MKPTKRGDKSNSRLEMSKSVSIRKRDRRSIVKRKKLARLRQPPSDSLKRRPKAKEAKARIRRNYMMMARPTTRSRKQRRVKTSQL